MGRVTFSEIISDIRGRVGTHIYSIWKGINVLKMQPKNFRYAWESQFNAVHRALIKDCAYRWRNVLTEELRATWALYAYRLGLLGYPYYGAGVKKLTGWKQYGGIMSGYNAYVLTNSLRRAIGKVDFNDTGPSEIEAPPQPIFSNFEYIPHSPGDFRVTVVKAEYLPEDTTVRAWCRGVRFAHLLLSKYQSMLPGGSIPWDVDYDCSDEPPAATPAWTLVGTDFCTVIDGIIQIDTVTPGVDKWCSYKLGVAGFDNAVGWVVETKKQVHTSAANDNRLVLTVADGTYKEIISFSETKILLGISGQEYVMDTTDRLHIYRITGKGDVVKVWVDGILRITGTLSWEVGLKEVTFGDEDMIGPENSLADWDYIKIYDGGDAAPQTFTLEWDKMHYAQGAEAGILPDIYRCQLDCIGDSGRFSPPSDIKVVQVT